MSSERCVQNRRFLLTIGRFLPIVPGMSTTSDLEHTPTSLRALRGFTKVSLCQAAGVGFETLQAIESGQMTARMETVEAVARVLEVPLTVYVAAMERARSRGAGSAA